MKSKGRENMVNVVLGIVERENKVLVIKRERGDFVGLWAIPGGKVEECEHIDEAVLREMFEELGVETKFQSVLGFVTEIMHDTNSTSLIYVCHLDLGKDCEITNPEFAYRWMSKEEIEICDDMIESDKMFIEEFYLKKSQRYLKLDCYRDEKGNYFWKK